MVLQVLKWPIAFQSAFFFFFSVVLQNRLYFEYTSNEMIRLMMIQYILKVISDKLSNFYVFVTVQYGLELCIN